MRANGSMQLVEQLTQDVFLRTASHVTFLHQIRTTHSLVLIALSVVLPSAKCLEECTLKLCYHALPHSMTLYPLKAHYFQLHARRCTATSFHTVAVTEMLRNLLSRELSFGNTITNCIFFKRPDKRRKRLSLTSLPLGPS